MNASGRFAQGVGKDRRSNAARLLPRRGLRASGAWRTRDRGTADPHRRSHQHLRADVYTACVVVAGGQVDLFRLRGHWQFCPKPSTSFSSTMQPGLHPVEQFRAVIDAVASGAPAVVPGLPVVDTIKEVDADSTVVRTVDRAALRGVKRRRVRPPRFWWLCMPMNGLAQQLTTREWSKPAVGWSR